MSHKLKNHLNCFKYNIFYFHKFLKKIYKNIRMVKLDYNNENIEKKKYLKTM